MKRTSVLLLLLAGCQSGALKEGLARAPLGLATTWIGASADGRTWYRLALDDEGTGTGATTRGQETAFYRVRRWENAEELTAHLELSDGAPDAPPRLDLRGTAKSWRLDLSVEGRHTVTLWRESDLMAARERMTAHASATTANPP
jgi:hypothetical protein